MIAVLVSAGVVLAGVYLLLADDTGAFAGFAWPFVVLGVLGFVGNLVLWARARRVGAPRSGGRS